MKNAKKEITTMVICLTEVQDQVSLSSWSPILANTYLNSFKAPIFSAKPSVKSPTKLRNSGNDESMIAAIRARPRSGTKLGKPPDGILKNSMKTNEVLNEINQK